MYLELDKGLNLATLCGRKESPAVIAKEVTFMDTRTTAAESSIVTTPWAMSVSNDFARDRMKSGGLYQVILAYARSLRRDARRHGGI
jgi:hypothetical protein